MNNKEFIVIGSGGGGGKGGGKTPTTADDNLNSIAKVNILDALGEGEIEGFNTAREEGHTQGSAAYNNAMLKDIFLDDTPILRKVANSASPADSDLNFEGVSVSERRGLGTQPLISGFGV